MKQILLTTMMIAIGTLLLSVQASNHYFVLPEGSGEGTSWKDAFSDLQAALAVAQDGDIIWVAEGVYFPTTDDDRTASLNSMEQRIALSRTSLFHNFAVAVRRDVSVLQ